MKEIKNMQILIFGIAYTYTHIYILVYKIILNKR